MKSFKSRQVWKTPKIDIAPIRIRYRVTEALLNVYFNATNNASRHEHKMNVETSQ